MASVLVEVRAELVKRGAGKREERRLSFRRLPRTELHPRERAGGEEHKDNDEEAEPLDELHGDASFHGCCRKCNTRTFGRDG